MKIVITGGTGFLGRLIAERALDRGDNVTLFDIAIPPDGLGALEGRAEMIAGDIADNEMVARVIEKSDAVVHLASMVSAGSEADFDAAMRVNIDGGRAVLDAARANGPHTKVLFTSSLAIFGSQAMPARVDGMTRPVPQNTYGMTKAVMELLVNDMSRKGFIDGRVGRLPTVIVRPGKPNTAASSFASGVIREPLTGDVCELPVAREMKLCVGGYRTCADGLMALLDAPAEQFGDDRVVNLPNITTSVNEMIAATENVAARHGITLGRIEDTPDEVVRAIVGSWPIALEASKALSLGCPQDGDLETIIEAFVEDYL
ncbi:MAG: NAD-dependent epimerase/dehydratase family protein [Rhodospirillales bacterium]|nr:NAD-dependent epimerase/dehydratase family protein [Rhodospirillales bacterium]